MALLWFTHLKNLRSIDDQTQTLLKRTFHIYNVLVNLYLNF